MPNVTAAPFIVQKPLIRLGATPNYIEIQCGATNVEVTPDQDENTVETFCGSYTSYKAIKWTVSVTLAQSYGANGTWTLLQPLVGTIIPFAVTPTVAAASVDNPAVSGTALVKAFPFISAAPGEASEVDLELAVQGALVTGIVLPTGLMADEEAATEAA